jgi:hypothetical protein
MVFTLSKEATEGWASKMIEMPSMLSFDRIPTANGVNHTSFMVVNDGKGIVAPFPPLNFCLLSEELQKEITEEFARYGLKLRVPKTPAP